MNKINRAYALLLELDSLKQNIDAKNAVNCPVELLLELVMRDAKALALEVIEQDECNNERRAG